MRPEGRRGHACRAWGRWYLHLTLGMAGGLGIQNPKQNNEATVWGPGSGPRPVGQCPLLSASPHQASHAGSVQGGPSLQSVHLLPGKGAGPRLLVPKARGHGSAEEQKGAGGGLGCRGVASNPA